MTTNDWRHQARCKDSTVDFFEFPTYRDKVAAKSICKSCPVRLDCLQEALNNSETFGVWGGVDEYELRRVMSVNKWGAPVQNGTDPRCPNCKTTTLQIIEKRRTRARVRCQKCDLTWETRRVINRRQRSDV